MKKERYLLWLPSWYPNKLEPYNGDFIQRHAYAAAAYVPVKLIHFVAAGPHVLMQQSEEIKSSGNLTEIIFYPEHTPVDNKFFNKLIYNYRFYTQARKRLKVFFATHGLPAGVHVHVPVKSGNLALWIRRKWGIPFVLSEQSSYYLHEAPNSFFVRGKWYQRQVRAIFKRAKAITNVSATIGKELKHLFSLKEITTIHNTVDVSLFHFKNKDVQKEFAFLHVSALNEQKNIKGILKAFAALDATRSDWQLVLAGPVSEDLKAFIHTLSYKNRIRLCGMIAYKKVAAEMQAADAFVLFSRHENFPCVVAEALCCGLPVVAGNVAGVGEAVNNSNGIFVNNNEAELVAALKKMRHEAHLFDRPAIAKAAADLYSYEVIGAQIFNLYRSNFNTGR